MNIDVDLFEGYIDEKKCNRINTVRQNGTIAGDQAACDHLVPDETPVHKEILRILICSPFSRCGDETTNGCNVFASAGNRQKTFEQHAPEYLKSTFAKVFCRRNLQNFAPIVNQRKCDLRMGQGMVLDDAGKMVILSRFGSHELPARRRVKEKIANRDRSPG